MKTSGRERFATLMARAVPNSPRVPTRFGDWLYSTRDFVIAHRRLPQQRDYLNDRLHELINSHEMLDPLRSFVTDKEYVKLFVAATVGTDHVLPSIAVIENEADALGYSYPERCVIKPSHLSGQVILRKNKKYKVDLERIRGWLRTNWYRRRGGWEVQYRHLSPKIIVEPFVFDQDNVFDIKLFCARGRVGMIQVDTGRHKDHRRAFFTPDWQRLPFGMAYPQPEAELRIRRPANLDRIISVAERLSAKFSFIRVDVYSNDADVIVGELTSCPEGALGVFDPEDAERDAFKLVFGAGEVD